MKQIFLLLLSARLYISTLTRNRVKPCHCLCTVQFIPRPTEPLSLSIRFSSLHVQDALVVTYLQAFFIRPRRRLPLWILGSSRSCQHEQQLCDRPWLCEKMNILATKRPVQRRNKRLVRVVVLRAGTWALLLFFLHIKDQCWGVCVIAKFFSA